MDALKVLSICPLFGNVNAASLQHLAARAKAVPIQAGETLIQAGDASHTMYIVATGRLRAVFPNGQVAGDIARLEPIGEIGVLTGEPRNATVYALRDSLLYAFNRRDLYRFAIAEPAALMAITQVIIHRMREPNRETRLRAARKIRTLAVVSASPTVSSTTFARELEQALGGHTPLITSALLQQHNLQQEESQRHWLRQMEFDHKQIVFDIEGDANWQTLALHQADRIIVVADTGTITADHLKMAFQKANPRASIELVIQRADNEASPHTLSLKRSLAAHNHYYVRPHHPEDMKSLARQLTGYGVGVVLGGGGARGFAHIGLLRAMRELDIPVDVCGGASMGAFVAALHACNYDEKTTIHLLKDTFIRHNLLNDYRLPIVSLIAGKKFRKHLHSIFGSQCIEHMHTPFFCVSTNLTHARSEEHNEGLLADWLAVSMCIPGLAPPAVWQDSLLCDGAVVNSLPTDVMQRLGRGLIVASDVSTEDAVSAPIAGGNNPDFDAVYRRYPDGGRVQLKDILFRTTTLAAESGRTLRAERADLYLRMPVEKIGTFDWKKIDETIECGYEYAMLHLPELKGKLQGEG